MWVPQSTNTARRIRRSDSTEVRYLAAAAAAAAAAASAAAASAAAASASASASVVTGSHPCG